MTSDFADFLSWYVAVGLAGWAAWPLTYAFFKRTPDKGFAFTKALGLLWIGYVFWLGGSLGFLRNNVGSILLATLMVAGLGLAVLRRPGVWELRHWMQDNRVYILGVEAVFVLAFGLWAWVRAHNPDISGTEKPMEFMFINAIVRSPAMPPQDAWLSGHAISYYYFGYVLVAMLTQITGVMTAVAFNLAVALCYGLVAVGALGMGVNLISLAQRELAHVSRESVPPVIRAFAPALLAPLLVLVVGNFYGVLRLAHANGWAADLQIPVVRYDFGTVTDNQVVRAPGVAFEMQNVWTWLDLKGMTEPPTATPAQFVADPGFWWWFNGARVVHDRNLVGTPTEAITEIPAFSFILGDLHPHVLALGFAFVAMVLALEWLQWGKHAPWPAAYTREALRPWVRAALFPVLGSAVILGGLAFLNTWDFPIYTFLVALALALGVGWQNGWHGLAARWPMLAALLAAMVLGGLLAYLPFYLTFQNQAGGIVPNLIYPTRFQQTVVLFGPALMVLTLFLGWLSVRARMVIDPTAALWAGGGLVIGLTVLMLMLAGVASLNPALVDVVNGALYPLSLSEAAPLLLQRRLVDSWAALVPALGIAVCVGLMVGALKKRHEAPPTRDVLLGLETTPLQMVRSPAALLALALALTGLLLVLGPEFVYLRDQFGTRMNTIFKFYFQAWTLWGVAGAFGLWYLTRHARPATHLTASVLTGVVVVLGLVYTVFGIYSAAGQFARTPTLNGMRYFAELYPNDWAAAQWLAEKAAPADVLAEGIGGQYWIEGRFSRLSMASGVPTVMGWPGHESQWRGPYFNQVAGREADIRQLYQARDWETARAILDRYRIRFVVLSDLERQKYGLAPESPQVVKFDLGLTPVFQQGDVTIYQHTLP